jgi:hypothetical protein
MNVEVLEDCEIIDDPYSSGNRRSFLIIKSEF